jgi:uncharacterized repeat protein (TIGR01451 family)
VPPLAAGATFGTLISVNPTQSGDYGCTQNGQTLVGNCIQGSVIGTDPEPSPDLNPNKAGVSSIHVSPAADLSISVGASPNPAQADEPLTYTITITNKGPLPATNVLLNTSIDGDSFLVPAGLSLDCKRINETRNVQCSIKSLAANSQTTETIMIRPSANSKQV